MGPTSFLPHPPLSSSSGCPHAAAAALHACARLPPGFVRAECRHCACSLWVAAARSLCWSSAACTRAPSRVLPLGCRHHAWRATALLTDYSLCVLCLQKRKRAMGHGHACVKREARKRKSEEQGWACPHEQLLTCSS